jgi:hypothetical protein
MEEAVAPAEYDAIGTALTGNRIASVKAGEIGGAAGKFRVSYDAEGNPVYNIFVNRNLNPETSVRVRGHEIGHAIDYFSRTIPTKGLDRELRTVYNDLNNSDLAAIRRYNPGVDPAKLSSKYRNFGPENHGYKAKDIQRELMAEAIRAYMSNPNYLKSVAPNVAARIRQYANPSPRNNAIQFNSLGPLGMLGGAGLAAGTLSDDR